SSLKVVITTFNEEVNVAECIESVLFADEILLVDSFSKDRTVEIAGRYPVTILQREYFGSAAQKNWALDRVKHDWVLIIDADERVPEALAREILSTLAEEPTVNGFYIRRENVFIDEVIRHSGWSTDKVVRLFRRDKGRYPNRRVHADLEIEGAVPVLRNPFLHYTFRTFDQYFPKFLNYAQWGAAQAFRDGRKAGVVELVFRPWWRFVRSYFVQGGILDGTHGFVVCSLQAFGVFLKYARLWEYRIRAARGEDLALPAFDDSEDTWKRPEAEG
ncbi:MAG: glycosyltransferase family 2 protein, partial [Thermoanaerobaculia bacterium]|nr:glycosyltransferase family 2 protein [Thermoanaerobaculia bacterium]